MNDLDLIETARKASEWLGDWIETQKNGREQDCGESEARLVRDKADA